MDVNCQALRLINRSRTHLKFLSRWIYHTHINQWLLLTRSWVLFMHKNKEIHPQVNSTEQRLCGDIIKDPIDWYIDQLVATNQHLIESNLDINRTSQFEDTKNSWADESSSLWYSNPLVIYGPSGRTFAFNVPRLVELTQKISPDTVSHHMALLNFTAS